MTLKARVLFAALAITFAVATIVHATPIVGFIGTILSQGSTQDEIRQGARVELPPDTAKPDVDRDRDGDHDDDWHAKLTTSGPTDVYVQDGTYVPNGHTGWHSHPGIILLSMISGSVEWYDADCVKHVYNAGDVWTESTQTHYMRNVGTVNAHFTVTYILAHGQPRRIDQPAPACAAALSLD